MVFMSWNLFSTEIEIMAWLHMFQKKNNDDDEK